MCWTPQHANKHIYVNAALNFSLPIYFFFINDFAFFSLSPQENPTVQILDMTDNEIGPKGASYIAEMLSDNRIITDLVSL